MFIKHDTIERHAWLMLVLALGTVSIGGIVEIIPTFTIETTVEHVRGVRPYSPLELAGRDIYVREGCYLCHSQMIRALKDEVERYGHYSLAAESMYDHPFQWGSKRIGPDLARVGGKYSNDWHYAHLTNPQALVPESLMPQYAFLAAADLRTDDIQDKMRALRMTGVPYTDAQIVAAPADLQTQANAQSDLAAFNKLYPKAILASGDGRKVTEMDALGGVSAGTRHDGEFRRHQRGNAAAVGLAAGGIDGGCALAADTLDHLHGGGVQPDRGDDVLAGAAKPPGAARVDSAAR